MFFGSINGVEGYVESCSGLVAGINMARLINYEKPIVFPQETMIGALSHYITSCDPKHFQPMNANFGIISPLSFKHKKKERKLLYASRALEEINKLKIMYNI